MANRELKQKETASLKQFVGLIEDVKNPHHGDRDFVRWLQAKGWNPKKASDFYRKNEQWRKNEGVEKLAKEYVEPEVMTLYYAGGVVGRNPDGCIIRVDPSGRNDVKGMLRSVKKDDLTKTIVSRMEHTVLDMRKWRQENGGTGDQVIQVMDMAGFVSNGLDMSIVNFYLETMKLLDNHYPGLMRKSYIVNAPSVFRMAWGVMKRVLSKEITEKFEICNDDWKEHLRAEIPEDQLPVAYGGTLVDPDGNESCPSLINYGGEVPSSYYKTVENCMPADDCATQHVGRADTLLVEAKVTTTPANLRWIFASEGNPLTFGIYRETTEGRRNLDKMEEVQAFRQVESHVIPEDGSMVCREPGTYFLVFDNRSSRFTRRKVTYQFRVEEVVPS